VPFAVVPFAAHRESAPSSSLHPLLHDLHTCSLLLLEEQHAPAETGRYRIQTCGPSQVDSATWNPGPRTCAPRAPYVPTNAVSTNAYSRLMNRSSMLHGRAGLYICQGQVASCDRSVLHLWPDAAQAVLSSNIVGAIAFSLPARGTGVPCPEVAAAVQAGGRRRTMHFVWLFQVRGVPDVRADAGSCTAMTALRSRNVLHCSSTVEPFQTVSLWRPGRPDPRTRSACQRWSSAARRTAQWTESKQFSINPNSKP